MTAPKHARWAWRVFWIIGGIECLAGLIVLGARDHFPHPWLSGPLTLVVGSGLMGIGFALSHRKRWAQRAAVALIALQIVVAIFGPGRATAPVLPAILLYFLLARDTRHWVGGDEERDRLEMIDERQSQRARRRLEPADPDIRSITERIDQRPRDED